jgi:hypothetical protein
MNQMLRLGVNIDHVATIRNARGGIHPCPLRAAEVAAAAGADGIFDTKASRLSLIPVLSAGIVIVNNRVV